MSKSKLLLVAVCVMGFSGDLFGQVKIYSPRPNGRFYYTANMGVGGSAKNHAGETLFIKLRYGKKAGEAGVIETSFAVEVNKNGTWSVNMKPQGSWIADGVHHFEVWSKDKMVNSVEIEIVGPNGNVFYRPEEHQPPKAVTKVVMMKPVYAGSKKVMTPSNMQAKPSELIGIAGNYVLPEGVDGSLNGSLLVYFRDKNNVIGNGGTTKMIIDTTRRSGYIFKVKTPTVPNEYFIEVKLGKKIIAESFIVVK